MRMHSEITSDSVFSLAVAKPSSPAERSPGGQRGSALRMRTYPQHTASWRAFTPRPFTSLAGLLYDPRPLSLGLEHGSPLPP